MTREQDTPANGGAEAEFEDVFATTAGKVGAKGANEENLDELEAFLDAFEKDPEAAANTVSAPRTAAPEKSTTDPAAPVVDFNAPEHVEALVHGLLKDDDFDLAATGGASTPAARPDPGSASTPPPATRAVHGGNRAQGPAPLAIATVAMSTVALLIAIGAGWASFGATTEPTTSAPAETHLAAELQALKQRVAELTARMEGPVGDITDSYPGDMDAFAKRLNELQGALAAVEQRLAVASATPAPRQAAPVRPAAVPTPPSGPAEENWQVNLLSFTERAGAEVELKRARAQGMDARIVPALRDGRTWYRVAVGGFASAEAARAYVAGEAKKAGYPAAWIARPQGQASSLR